MLVFAAVETAGAGAPVLSISHSGGALDFIRAFLYFLYFIHNSTLPQGINII